MNYLLVVVKFCNPILFANDFKILAHRNLESEIQSVLELIAQWVKENKTELAPDKCSQLVIRELNPFFDFPEAL